METLKRWHYRDSAGPSAGQADSNERVVSYLTRTPERVEK